MRAALLSAKLQNMEIERLKALIKEYQSRVQEAVSLFVTHKNINPIEWMQEKLPQIGFLDSEKTIKYFFHGIGCRVDLPSGPVDWDFGYGDRHDGFDVWRLWQFAKEGTRNFPEFADKDKLEAVFAEATAKGIIKKLHKEHHDDLSYFTE